MADDLLEKLNREGFAVIEDFLTDGEIVDMKAECATLVDKMDPREHQVIFSTTNDQPNLRDDYFINSSDKIRYFFEEEALDKNGLLVVDKHVALNKIGHALHVFAPSFRRVTFSDKVKDLVRRLDFQDPVVMQSMYIFKQPKIGGVVTPHQDGSYLYTEPQKVVGLWFALEDTTTENGCLSFIPGSHKHGLHGQYRLVRIQDNGIKCVYEGEKPKYDASQFVPVPVSKGSLVLIDGLVVHQSEPNRSEKSRHVFTLHIYDSASSVWSDRNWLQPTSQNTFTHLYDVTMST